MDILEKIQPVFRDVFDDDGLVITEKTTASDIEDWDSFTQIHIISGIEELFSFKFQIEEISNLKNVGDLVKAIESHV